MIKRLVRSQAICHNPRMACNKTGKRKRFAYHNLVPIRKNLPNPGH